MKKFITFSIVIALTLISISYMVYFKGFYFHFQDDAKIKTYAKVEDKKIKMRNQVGDFEDFIIKGVDLSSSIAGHYSSDYAIDKQTYLRWFKDIQAMGANTIRIYTIYDDDFYDAIYEYNLDNMKPLYLLQGIQVSDYANYNHQDIYGKEFYYALKQDAKDVVDVIHGRKIISTNKMKGSGYYGKDISSWTLGYIVGNVWKADTIAYSNHSDNMDTYRGEYFKTAPSASNFEVMITRVMDELIGYENDKYGSQSLITFASSPEIDPFTYEKQYASQIGKFESVDPEHIIPTNKLQSGYFASYKLYEYCPNFKAYFSPSQKEELGDILSKIDTSLYYEGYSQLLHNYHSMPVVISGFGYSSSRGGDQATTVLNEQQQGEAILKTYKDIIASGCSGGFIDSWQDSWDRRAWNTAYAVDLNEMYRWHDIQSGSTGYGLLSFASQSNLMNGSDQDWTDKTTIVDQDGWKMNVTSDEVGIYLFIQKAGFSKNDELFIPLDITDKSGSKVDDKTKVRFDREADFLIHINQEKSKIMVQSRYEALRENYLTQTTGRDPFVEIPNLHASSFMPIHMLEKQKHIIEESMDDEEKFKLKLYQTFETGLLKESNQQSGSLGDFAYGKDSLEIRIPWQLLNFYNPVDHEIHDDYYAGNYGVKGMGKSNIYIGVGNGEQRINMKKMKLKSLSSLKFKERLKKSYEIIKEEWGE